MIVRYVVLFCLGAVCMLASSDASIEVYKNTIIIKESHPVTSPDAVLMLPANINLNSMEISSSCDVLSKRLVRRDAQKGSERERAMLRHEELQNKETALNDKISLLRKASLVDSNLSSKIADEYESILSSSLQKLTMVKKELASIREEIDSYKDGAYSELILKFNCTPSTVLLTYPIAMQIDKLSKIKADTKRNKISVEQSISFASPISSKNLSIKLLPIEFRSNLNPPVFVPNILRPNAEADNALLSARSADKSIRLKCASSQLDTNSIANASQAPIIRQQETSIANLWTIDHVSTKRNEITTLTFNTQEFDASFDIFIAGYNGNQPFLRSKFTNLQPIEESYATFFVDGETVGRSFIQDIKKSKNTLYFSNINLVKVEKKDLADFSKDTFFSGKQTSFGFKYSIINSSERPWDIVLADVLPISADEKIKVENSSKPKEAIVSENGEIHWNFSLKPKEISEINFAYTVSDSSQK